MIMDQVKFVRVVITAAINAMVLLAHNAQHVQVVLTEPIILVIN